MATLHTPWAGLVYGYSNNILLLLVVLVTVLLQNVYILIKQVYGIVKRVGGLIFQASL